jgi:hypothetical protein
MHNVAYLLDADTSYLTQIVSEERAYRQRHGVPMYYRRYFDVALYVLSGRAASAVGSSRTADYFASKVVDCLTREYYDEADYIVVVL